MKDLDRRTDSRGRNCPGPLRRDPEYRGTKRANSWRDSRGRRSPTYTTRGGCLACPAAMASATWDADDLDSTGSTKQRRNLCPPVCNVGGIGRLLKHL